MRTQVIGAIVWVALAIPLLVDARPYPAGSCSVLDDGVATPLRGEPLAVSMPIPADAAEQFKSSFDVAVVDLSFVLELAGGVSRVKLLCASPANPDFVDALMRAASTWKFAPAGQGAAPYRRIAYRIVIRPASGASSSRSDTVFLGA